MDTKRITSSFTADRISNLPCNVIDDILKYLPLRDVVRTSILSREWRYKWITVPCLVFDENFEDGLDENYNIESIIYQVLLLHKGPIVKFTYMAHSHPAAADQWLHLLSNHRIEELKLCFPNSAIHETMPCHLFSFGKLRDLCLLNCQLTPPCEFQGFGRLVRLDLYDVLIEPGEFRRFIAKCPMLQHLNICCLFNTKFADFEIDAPNLKSFCFFGELLSVSLRNTSLLENVSMVLSGSATFRDPQTNLIKFLSQLTSIKRLNLNRGFLQLTAKGGVPQKLAYNLSHLMVLRLTCIDFVSISEVSCAVCLIRSSPNMQSLEIQSTTLEGDVKPATLFLKAQQDCKVTLARLKDVWIYAFSGSEPEMEFVKLLLSSATALRKLELKLNPSLNSATEQGYLMVKKLTSFHRASPEAEIIT